MIFRQAVLETHIAIIRTDDELGAFIDRAGVDQRYHTMTREMFGAIGRLSLTNATTGEYCLAYKYIPSLTEQAICGI